MSVRMRFSLEPVKEKTHARGCYLDQSTLLVTRPERNPQMCINPSYVWQCIGSEWRKQPIACRQCWRCKKNRINDYVGRCLAEAATSLHVCAITLTYAPRDDLADKVLNPRHFQLFMKLLRRAGHKVRYLVAGEYGDLKGRSHFHALLFFTEMQPGDKPVVYNWGHLADPSTSGRFCRQIPNMDMVHIRELAARPC